MNTFPENGSVYDFCFEKKGNGQWIGWMDTVDKHYHHITPTSKVFIFIFIIVSFTLVHVGKYRTEDRFKIQSYIQTKHNPEKANNAKRSKTQNKTTLTESPFTTLGQESRWAYYTMLLSPHGA